MKSPELLEDSGVPEHNPILLTGQYPNSAGRGEYCSPVNRGRMGGVKHLALADHFRYIFPWKHILPNVPKVGPGEKRS